MEQEHKHRYPCHPYFGGANPSHSPSCIPIFFHRPSRKHIYMNVLLLCMYVFAMQQYLPTYIFTCENRFLRYYTYTSRYVKSTFLIIIIIIWNYYSSFPSSQPEFRVLINVILQHCYSPLCIIFGRHSLWFACLDGIFLIPRQQRRIFQRQFCAVLNDH